MTEERATKRRPRAVEQALDLVRRFRSGELSAYVSPAAREEQYLDPLRGADAERTVEHLLQLSADDEALPAEVLSIGARRALSLLSKVLCSPGPPSEGQYSIYTYFERTVEDVTWLLERVEIGLTGLLVHTSIWLRWSAGTLEEAWPEWPNADQYFDDDSIDWSADAEITDDAGTRYGDGHTMEELHTPEVVACGGSFQVSLVHRYSTGWYPAPSFHATRLVVRPESVLTVRLPSGRGYPRLSRQVDLGPLACTVRLRGIGSRL